MHTGSPFLRSREATGYQKCWPLSGAACSLTCSYVCLGEQRPTVLVGMEIRDLNLKDSWVKTFGTIDSGLELMNASWPAMQQVFAVCREEMPALERLHKDQGTPPPQLYKARYPSSLLTRNPVDLLIIDKGCITQVASAWIRAQPVGDSPGPYGSGGATQSGGRDLVVKCADLGEGSGRQCMSGALAGAGLCLLLPTCGCDSIKLGVRSNRSGSLQSE